MSTSRVTVISRSLEPFRGRWLRTRLTGGCWGWREVVSGGGKTGAHAAGYRS